MRKKNIYHNQCDVCFQPIMAGQKATMIYIKNGILNAAGVLTTLEEKDLLMCYQCGEHVITELPDEKEEEAGLYEKRT